VIEWARARDAGALEGVADSRRSAKRPKQSAEAAELRGVSTLTSFGLAVEIGDWTRLSGRSIGAYLGSVPTESSSGGSRSQGSITKTGNGHARRLLIEAAWHHRQPYRRPGVDLRRRHQRATPAARDRGEQANRRLHARWAAFDARHKRALVANTAVARELAGWCWSLAVLGG
jgi:transposase